MPFTVVRVAAVSKTTTITIVTMVDVLINSRELDFEWLPVGTEEGTDSGTL